MGATIKWVESQIGRSLTDDEKERVKIDCEISKKINIGNVDALKKFGIDELLGGEHGE